MNAKRLMLMALFGWAVYISYMVVSPPAKAVTVSMSSCRGQTFVTSPTTSSSYWPTGGSANNANPGMFNYFRGGWVDCPAGQVINRVHLTSSDVAMSGAWILGIQVQCCSLVA